MKHLLLLFTFVFVASQNKAQDILGAYIRSQYVPTTNTFTPVYEYSLTVTLLTDASLNIPRPTITLTFTGPSNETFSLISTSPASNGIIVKKYAGTHTYPGPSPPQTHLKVNYLDSFRVTGIKNISIAETQSILAETRIFANTISMTNTTVVIANEHCNLSVSENKVLFDPGISDPEGDSLSFSLVNCATNNYRLPVGAATGSTGVVSFSKDSIGLYAFCLQINEWKKNIFGLWQGNGVTFFDFVLNITSTVGILKFGVKHNAEVYPNPVKDKLTLDFIRPNSQLIKVNIINTLGQLVFGLNCPSQKQELDIRFLPPGIYYLKLEDQNENRVIKIIKN